MVKVLVKVCLLMYVMAVIGHVINLIRIAGDIHFYLNERFYFRLRI